MESNDVADVLLEFARTNNVDLIVVGGGRTANAVVANAHCSVHVVC